MHVSVAEKFRQEVAGLKKADPQYAVLVVDRVLAAGREACVSDMHFTLSADGLQLRWRLDGVLQELTRFPREVSPS